MGLLITTLSLAIAATNPAGESEYNTDLNLNLGGKHYIGAAAAGSEGSWYFKPGVAINMVDDVDLFINLNSLGLGIGIFTFEFETSTSISLGFGTHITKNMRLEFDYFESENEVVILKTATDITLDQKTISFMNLIDFDTGTNLTPYIGAGVAIIHSELSGYGVSTTGSNDTTLILCAGTDWAISENMDLYAEYRITSPAFDLFGSNVDIRNRTVFLGIHWRF